MTTKATSFFAPGSDTAEVIRQQKAFSTSDVAVSLCIVADGSPAVSAPENDGDPACLTERTAIKAIIDRH